MDFDLNPEQCAFDDGVSRFAQATLADMGLLGIAMPVEDGGQGGALTDAVIAIQALAAVRPKSADVVQAGDFGASAPSPNTPAPTG
jgi:alkylation response protein AidB-like acyl-CoA dehydrogenase